MAFSAQLSIPTLSANRYVDALCEELATMEIEAVRDGDGARIELPRALGTARIEADDQSLRVHAEAASERGISALKFILGLRIEKVAEAEKPELIWTGYGADFTVLPSLREITVARVTDLTPHMRRITFTGHDMGRFHGEEIHVRLLFPPAGLERPEWPKPGKNGRPAWPPEERRPATRVYTIRDYDKERGTVDIDFVLHGDHGIAGKWALAAAPGQMIGMMGPGGGEPEPAGWSLFAGDETAIPAIARRLRALPPQARGVALIEVADSSEQQQLASPAGMAVTWLHRNGAEAGRNTLLLDAVRAAPIPENRDDCLFWLGAEAATARAARTLWRDELQLPRKAIRALAYWRHDLTEGEE
jgi:NADPH-dependent ferric siderophore reductase